MEDFFQLYYKCTLKNKGASGCHIRIFLSTWVHREPLTSEETFFFTKGYLWWKKVLQIIKKQGRHGSLMNIWLVHWGTKNCYYMASSWIIFELLLFFKNKVGHSYKFIRIGNLYLVKYIQIAMRSGWLISGSQRVACSPRGGAGPVCRC